MEINLKEGEEVKIKADKGTAEAYATTVCYKNCILAKSLLSQEMLNDFEIKNRK